MMSHEVPERPWQNVATDLFQWKDRHYILVVDYYSRYFEVAQLHSTKATSVINQMKAMFARHGIPSKVISDQGPQYSSAEFLEFSKTWGFQHVTSSPYYPRGNALSERTVQTVKNILKKSTADNTDPLLGFLEYRNSPVDNIASPAELLMGRKLSSLLPSLDKSLQPKPQNSQKVKKALHMKQIKQKQYYDRGTKTLKPLDRGERVRVLHQNKWEPGLVKDKLTSPRSYLVSMPNGSVYQRNRSHILKSCEGKDMKVKQEIVDTSETKEQVSDSNKQLKTRYGRQIKPVIKY